MLAVSPLGNTTKGHHEGETTSSHDMCGFTINPEEFPEFADHGNLLESIDFDDLFNGIDDRDVLPDLEMDPEILSDFSGNGGQETSSDQMNMSSVTTETANNNFNVTATSKEDGDRGVFGRGDEVVSKREDNGNKAGRDKKRKYSSGQGKNSNNTNNNNNQGKPRKVKVDWTPELHRRFVQAVEQLGVDKAVPSRILELMGIDCLTRHNVASHLQKYRSHRKHLLAREAEAASWTQKRQIYGAAAGAGGGKNAWLAPTMGFPPAAPMTPPMHHHHHHHHHPHFRPLHVWGHPTMDQSVMPHMWPKHLSHSPSPVAHPPIWAPQPSTDPTFWHQRVPNGPTPGTPYFPQPLAAPMRFGAPPVPGIPPPPHHHPGIGLPAGQSGPRPPIDFHPSKESIDAAIGDVLSKPWLPLPLGLKPPSNDSVLGELHRQGVSKVPPAPSSCA